MGKNQSTTASWSADDWAYGTGINAVSIDELVEETSKIPEKYFGGRIIQNDASMHQMQRDLLSFDETVLNLFRRKKNKRSKSKISTEEDYSNYDEQQPTDSGENHDYLQPIPTNGNVPPPLPPVTYPRGSLFWRCGNCTVENKVTDRVCHRCGQAETRL